MWTIPDKNEGDSNIQSVLFQEYLDVLAAGLAGIDCVLSGLTMTSNSNMVPSVAKGSVLSNKIMYAVAAGTVTITTADATNPRIDLVVVNSSGALAVRAGTPAAAPKPAARTANDVVIYAVYVPANDTSIGATQFTDMRVTPPCPLMVYRVTTPNTISSFAVKTTIFTKTIPNGLMQAGRGVRVRMGGYFLLNSGTPILTLTIDYGGTTFFADPMLIGAADPDEGAWFLEFNLTHQATNAQFINGQISFEPTIASRVAPTTGIAGNLGQSTTAANHNLISPFCGIDGTVDSDAADRALTVSWTCDVSNAANAVSMKFATMELL